MSFHFFSICKMQSEFRYLNLSASNLLISLFCYCCWFVWLPACLILLLKEELNKSDKRQVQFFLYIYFILFSSISFVSIQSDSAFWWFLIQVQNANESGNKTTRKTEKTHNSKLSWFLIWIRSVYEVGDMANICKMIVPMYFLQFRIAIQEARYAEIIEYNQCHIQLKACFCDFIRFLLRNKKILKNIDFGVKYNLNFGRKHPENELNEKIRWHWTTDRFSLKCCRQ